MLDRQTDAQTSDGTIPVLDHGYVMLIEHWGSDERIIEAARMSTNKGFQGWGPNIVRVRQCDECMIFEDEPGGKGECIGGGTHTYLTGQSVERRVSGDEKLLAYLYKHKHSSPFEMAGMIIEVQAPIFVFREWHRHRTQCLAPDTLIHFDSPKSRSNRRFVYKMRIEDIWRKWQPTIRTTRLERQTNSLWPRSRIQEMQLRCADELQSEIVYTRVLDVIKGDPKPMIRVTTSSGKSLSASLDHKVFTSVGWLTLQEAIRTNSLLAVEGVKRFNTLGWETPPIDESAEIWRPILGWSDLYEVSNMGRVRRVGCPPKKTTIGLHGYPVTNLNRPGQQVLRTVHSLVLETFIGIKVEGQEARHLDNNRWNSRLDNLSWGSSEDNSGDMIKSDRQQRLVVNFEEIVSIEDLGLVESYDLEVEGPWHNFIADGFVVHNSYNEMSARYTPLPDLNYVPTVERLMSMSQSNKQASASSDADMLTENKAREWIGYLSEQHRLAQTCYEVGLKIGVPKELARLCLPVARYSRMRASANLRNWLAFLTLRMAPNAQMEIREYASVVGGLVAELFPRTWSLFVEDLER